MGFMSCVQKTTAIPSHPSKDSYLNPLLNHCFNLSLRVKTSDVFLKLVLLVVSKCRLIHRWVWSEGTESAMCGRAIWCDELQSAVCGSAIWCGELQSAICERAIWCHELLSAMCGRAAGAMSCCRPCVGVQLVHWAAERYAGDRVQTCKEQIKQPHFYLFTYL